MLDDDAEYANERDRLLERFRESLSKPMSERFFDQDDLVEIFDYAGDLNDDFLRMEALLCGARYFPDSDELLERRAIFYSQYSADACVQFLAKNPPNGNLILEVLSLRETPPMPEIAPMALDELISRYDRLADEEVIQLVDLAADLKQLSWLKANENKLRKKAQFPTVLLFELSSVAEQAKDFAYGAQMLEELTQAEPFNSYYWLRLAHMYNECDEQDKALNAIDYALAINPDSDLALLVKSRILYAIEGPSDKVVDTLKASLALSPANIDALRLLCLCYEGRGEDNLCVPILEAALLVATPEQSLDIIPELLTYDDTDSDVLFDQYYEACEDKSQLMWATWAQQLSVQGYPQLAMRAIKCYERNSGTSMPSMFAAEDAFTRGKFAETLSLMTEYLKLSDSTESKFPAVALMHIISLLKIGETDKALTLCDFFERNIDIRKFPIVSMRMEYLGLMQVIRDIKRKAIDNPGSDFWQDYNPLGIW